MPVLPLYDNTDHLMGRPLDGQEQVVSGKSRTMRGSAEPLMTKVAIFESSTADRIAIATHRFVLLCVLLCMMLYWIIYFIAHSFVCSMEK